MTTAQQLVTDAYRENNLIPIGTTPSSAQLTEGLARLNRYILGVYGQIVGEYMLDWPVPQPQRTATILANYPQAPYPMNIDAGIQAFPYSQDATVAIWPYPPKNSRIVWGGSNQKVWFPEQPDPGSCIMAVQGSGAGDGNSAYGDILTLDGNGRLLDPGTAGSTPQRQLTFTNPLAAAQRWMYREDLGVWMTVKEMALTDNVPFPEDLDDLWTAMLAVRLAPRYGKQMSSETQTTIASMLNTVKTRYKQSGVTIYGSFDFPRSLQSYTSGQWFW